MSQPEIGEQPEPVIEPGEPAPGGVDALADTGTAGQTEAEPLVRDLHPDDNPAVEDAAPDEISEPEDKQQEPDEDSGSADAPSEPAD